MRKFLALLLTVTTIGCSAATAPAPAATPFHADIRVYSGHGDVFKQFEGKRTLVVFWATWCSTCKEELPSVIRLSNALKSHDAQVITVASMDDAASVRTWVGSNQFPLPVLLDPDGKIAQRLGAQQLPVTIMFNADGSRAEFPDPDDGLLTPMIKGARRWDAPNIVAFLRNPRT